MPISFSKYQGTGNDFVIIDNRDGKIVHTDSKLIERLCNRKFGIGADGLILLEEELGFHFKMVYFNADGRESTMCGNGGRCIVAFAKQLGLIEDKASFVAIDGPHEAKIEGVRVELKMNNVDTVQQNEDHYVLDTGSPHYVKFVADKLQVNVFEEGRAIRQSAPFQAEGINVNFVEHTAAGIGVQTYERGVEDETLSCGTGVTAAAIAFAIDRAHFGALHVPVQTKGGLLAVKLNRGTDNFTDIWLCGPARFVYQGEIDPVLHPVTRY